MTARLGGVTICVCTYRRPALFDTLKSFELMLGVEEHKVNIVVIDNDATDIIRSRIDEFSKEYKFPLRYIHAPVQNISVARNAALEAVQTRWLLFIDDDEVADPQWLIKIMENSASSEAVIGQCIATYGSTLPKWLERCDFHSNRITGSNANAYTSNALLDMEFIRSGNFRFRPELGKTGGEDTIFFHEVSRAGARITYVPEAIVFEDVPLSRAKMDWVKTRMYRAGQTHGLVTREFYPRAFSTLAISAGVKALFSFAMALVTIPGTDQSRKWLARSYLHAGAVHYRIKPEIIEEYG